MEYIVAGNLTRPALLLSGLYPVLTMLGNWVLKSYVWNFYSCRGKVNTCVCSDASRNVSLLHVSCVPTPPNVLAVIYSLTLA